MAKCKLKIRLDKDSFRQKELISGEVEVRVNKDCKCKSLVLESTWLTSGRGDVDKGQGLAQNLFSGQWQAGRTHKYRFELPTSAGPCTYRGHLINLEWQLRVRADIPWAIDPKDRVGFVLRPGPVSNYFPGPSYKAPLIGGSTHLSQLQKMAGGLMLGTILGVWGLSLVFGSGHTPGPILFVLALAAFSYGLYKPIKRIIASKKLKKMSVDFSRTVFTPGHPIEFGIQFTGERNMPLNRIVATMRAQEAATYRQRTGSGSNRSTSRQTVRHQVLKASSYPSFDRAAVRHGRQVAISVALDLPRDCPLSMSTGYNKVQWFVDVELDFEGWPDWKQTYSVAVLPSPDLKNKTVPQARPVPAAQAAQIPVPVLPGPAPTTGSGATPDSGAAPVAARTHSPSSPPPSAPASAEPTEHVLVELMPVPPLEIEQDGLMDEGPATGERMTKSGTWLLALTKLNGTLHHEVKGLAPLFGMQPYDLRLKLAGPLPLILGRGLDDRAARKLMDGLRARGHGVLSLDMGQLVSSESLMQVREFRFEHDELQVVGQKGWQRRLPWSDVVALIPAVHLESQSRTQKSKQKRSRRLRGKKDKVETERVENRQEVFYAVCCRIEQSLIFSENVVRYSGLGQQKAETINQNFSTLCAYLRRLAPQAFYDERMRKHIRSGDQYSISASVGQKVLSKSNSSQTDQMVQILVAAHYQGLL